MLVTESGIVTLVRPLQPKNAPLPILVTKSGIVTLPLTPCTRVFPSFESNSPLIDLYFAFPAPTDMFASPLQWENAQFPMLVTPLPIVTLVSPLQPENAERPMLVTLAGITRLVRPIQPSNDCCPMRITLFGIVKLVSPLQFENA